MKRKLVLASLFSGLAFAQPTSMSSLTGSWQLTLTPKAPIAAAIPLAAVPGLVTFTSDGSLVESDATEAVPSAIAVYGTPGHGIWQPGPAIGNFYIQYISLFVNHNATLHSKKTVTITGTTQQATTSPASTVIRLPIPLVMRSPRAQAR
jgi:hypothetical protein